MANNVAAQKPIVLVVEDEPLVLLDAADMIEAEGYEVILASSADEAIALLKTRDDIRIVFTDIEMPGSMDGLNLARVVREKWPPVELIITSGKHRPNSADLPARGRFIEKPYTTREVKDALRAFAR